MEKIEAIWSVQATRRRETSTVGYIAKNQTQGKKSPKMASLIKIYQLRKKWLGLKKKLGR
jgi:hypothetical protein